MIIDGLPSLGSPQSGDELPIERGQATYKIDYDALAAAIINRLGDPVGAAHGGTGLTSLNASMNAFINSLDVGNSAPVGDDYFIAQYAGGGDNNTNYYRRKISKLYDYIKEQYVTLGTVSLGSGAGTYMTSVNGGFLKLGRINVFSIQFVMSNAISVSLTDAIQGFPRCLYTSKFSVNNNSEQDTDMTRTANINIYGNMTIKGAFPVGTYNVSGAYISAWGY